jgi:hypothetical protein
MPLEWREESHLAVFIESQQYLRVIDLSRARDRFDHKDLSTLQDITIAVRSIQGHVYPSHKHYLRINELLLFLQNLSTNLLSLPVTQAFGRVQLIRQWLFWLPAAMLRDGDTISLAILAQFCAVGVALDYLFPELGGAYLGPLFAGPMEELSRIVYERSVIAPLAMDVQLSLDLMECRGSLLLSSMMGTTSPHAMYAHDGIWASCPEPSFSLSTMSDVRPEGIRQYCQFLREALKLLGAPS